jgi:chitinase
MAYDMHGAWDVYTHHHTTMYENSQDNAYNNSLLNVDHAIKLWHELGAPYDKLVLGMGSYGRGFTLDDANNNGLYAPASQPISAGPFTREAGMWGYNEICEKLVSEQWKVTLLDDSIRAPFATKDRNWIGYDDIQSLTVKAVYARDLGLQGAMMWSFETDDFHGRCHGETFPLIRAVHRALNGDIVVPPPATTTTTTRDPSAPPPEETTTTPRPTPPTGKPGEVCQKPGMNKDPEDCNKFYVCTLTDGEYTADHRACGAGTAFNPIYENCDWPENVPGCH